MPNSRLNPKSRELSNSQRLSQELLNSRRETLQFERSQLYDHNSRDLNYMITSWKEPKNNFSCCKDIFHFTSDVLWLKSVLIQFVAQSKPAYYANMRIHWMYNTTFVIPYYVLNTHVTQTTEFLFDLAAISLPDFERSNWVKIDSAITAFLGKFLRGENRFPRCHRSSFKFGR